MKGLISKSTRSGLGRIGVRNESFLLRGLLAGAPEVALARLGPEMVTALRVLLAGASELALAKKGLEMVLF